MKGNKKAILAIAVTLLLAAALFVGAGAAAGNDTVIGYGITQYTYDGYTSLTDFANVAPFNGNVTVEDNCLILQKDIELTDKKAVIICGADIKLNLNGYMLKAADGGSYAIYVQKNAKLTLCDENTDTYCTGSHTYITVEEDGKTPKTVTLPSPGGLITSTRITSDGYISGGSGISNEGTLIMLSGTIAGNGKTDSWGKTGYYGGVTNLGGGTFTMEGGVISDTFANYGGNVYNKEANAEFILKDGKLTCGFTGYGGAVFNSGANTKFTMEGGELSNNIASYGAVYNSGSGSSITISGGKVINNKGQFGGGFNINSGTTFVMSGGEISGNLGQYKSGASGDFGGGVYVNGGSFSLSGGKIYNNSLTLWHSEGDPVVSCDIYENNDNASFTISSNAQIGTPEYPGAICLRAAYTTRPVFTIAAGCTPNQVEGYTFNGWFNEATGGELKIGPGAGTIQATGNKDIWLYPQWTAQAVTVTFDKNGGDEDADPKTIDEAYGSTYVLPNTNPTWTGHTFAGWYTSATGGDQVTSSTVVTATEAHTLYAHWTVDAYTVTFDKNGGDEDADPKTLDETFGSTYQLPTTNPTWTGHTFAGWYSSATGGDQVTSSTVVTATEAHTLYAHWTVNQYTVTFDADGGEPVPDEQKINYGECVVEPESPDKEGFTFAGWCLNEELYNFNTPVTQDLTLTAAWSEVEPVYHKVTFKPGNGDEDTTQWVISGGYITKPADPEKTGSVFLGWFQKGSTVEFIFTSFNVTEDLELIAHWKVTIPTTDKEIENIVDDVKKSEGGVVVEVSGADQEAVEKLITEAQNKGVADKVQLDVNESSAATVGEAINAVENLEKPVPVTVTDGNKTAVTTVLENVEDKSKISLPVSGDGKNIKTILEISGNKDYKDVNVSVPEKIAVSEPVTMTLGEGAKTVTLEDIARGASNGNSAEKLTLDLVWEDLNVQDAVSILGGDGVRGDLIKVDNEPEEVVVTTTPDKIDKEKGKLTPEEDARIAEVSIVKVEGVTAAAVSKKKETTIEKKEKITPAQPQEPTRGYEKQEIHTVFQIVVPKAAERKEAVTVTFEVTLKDGEDSSKLSNFYLKHYNGTGWDEGHIAQSAQPKAVAGKENTWSLTFRMTEFSPFALVSETALPKSSSSSSSGGASVWATPTPTPAVPTTEPTPVPTPGAVETPTVKPTAEQPTGKTPAPFAGILAGLGAAAMVFGLRRK